MLIDLHAYVPHGPGSLVRVVENARRSGLDGVCIVDRNAARDAARGVLEGRFGDYPVFVGVEISSRSGDAILIVPALDPFVTREEWRAVDSLNSRPTLATLQGLAEAEGGVLLLSHPYDRSRKVAMWDRHFLAKRVAGVEIATGGADERANALAMDAVSRALFPVFAGSADRRERQGLPRWATLLGAQAKTQAELVAVLAAGDFWAVELGGGGGRSDVAPAAPRVQAVSEPGRILITGTGAFAARIACDLAATSRAPIHLTIAGRNAERRDWLVTACRARAATFGTPVTVTGATTDLASVETIAPTIAGARPHIVVQAASLQTSAVIARSGDAWSQLVVDGGLSATAVFQAVLSARVGHAMVREAPGARLVNCCFPDVVNGMLAALGLPVVCGVGNVGILSSAFAGALGPGGIERVKVLAHYQTIGAWRRAADDRDGFMPPRVWIDGAEIADVHVRFRDVRLTREPAIEVSGSASVPLLVAMATPGAEITAHAPGALGLPGGYPVRVRNGTLSLDLPPGLSQDEAVAWNLSFERANGLIVGPDGQVRYTGLLHDRLAALSPGLDAGFAMRDLEAVYAEMAALRDRLRAEACGGGADAAPA